MVHASRVLQELESVPVERAGSAGLSRADDPGEVVEGLGYPHGLGYMEYFLRYGRWLRWSWEMVRSDASGVFVPEGVFIGNIKYKSDGGAHASARKEERWCGLREWGGHVSSAKNDGTTLAVRTRENDDLSYM